MRLGGRLKTVKSQPPCSPYKEEGRGDATLIHFFHPIPSAAAISIFFSFLPPASAITISIFFSFVPPASAITMVRGGG